MSMAKLQDLSSLGALLSETEKHDLMRAEKAERKKKPYGEQEVRVSIDKKRRRGKTVTLIEGLKMTNDRREELAKELKQLVSAGGTASTPEEIELQGDHIAKVTKRLEELGFKVRK